MVSEKGVFQMAQRTVRRSREQIGVYLRTSGPDSSLHKQKSMYTARIGRVPAWKLAGFYADPGLSKDTAAGRTDLQRLLRDCWNGKVTHIVTKSIGNLSTNADELSALFQLLNSLPQPVGVYFEAERFDSQGREDMFSQLL